MKEVSREEYNALLAELAEVEKDLDELEKLVPKCLCPDFLAAELKRLRQEKERIERRCVGEE